MIPTKELDPVEKSSIVQTGVMFMRSITEVYGTDEGIKLWDTIANTLDPQIKGHIFFAMLTGEYNNVVSIRGIDPSYTHNKVPVIKCIRSYTGCGLKEAKDICDEVWMGKLVKIEINPKDRTDLMKELQNLGCRL